MYIVGNWKMYKTARDAKLYIDALLPQVKGSSASIYLAVPFTSIAVAKNEKIHIGAQNMSDAIEGAFTGEISAPMLKEAGASFVLLGHSERRLFFGETDAFIRRKVLTALKEQLQPILCIGETAQERDAGRTGEAIRLQLKNALQGIDKPQNLLIAYEPIWAIGTGKKASADQIQEAHRSCQACLQELFGKKVPVLYGGSVTAENIADIVALPEVAGALVGGASLDPNAFAKMIKIIELRK